jgi:hypothetical protein
MPPLAANDFSAMRTPLQRSSSEEFKKRAGFYRAIVVLADGQREAATSSVRSFSRTF